MTQTTPLAAGNESFASLFEASVTRADQLKEGDVVVGTVLKVGNDTVVVDIGYKSEGVISASEFVDAGGEVAIQVGDQVDVLLESKETDDGLVLLSKEKADKLKVWDEIAEACERDELIEGTIVSRVKGGLSVSIRGGVKAFLPGSLVDLRRVRDIDKLLGQTYQFKVIKFNKKRGNIVLSRRVLLEKQRDELKKQTLERLEEGQIVTGVIKNLTEYGAFVDLGGIDGLLHITDMSWGRINHPSEVFSVGDEVTVKVLKYNPDKERVSLGLKQTMDDPWTAAESSYKPGARVKGKVVSLADYGAFVEMAEGVEGLIHVSEMSWKKPKHPSKVLEIGQELECVVLDVDMQNKRISLGLKQLEPDPWSAFVATYNPGDIIRGKVRSITDYGVFVGIEEGVDGMVHRSDLSWTNRVGNPGDVYHKGDEVEAIILSINHEEKRVSLGIKQLYDDPWADLYQTYSEGMVLEVRIIAYGDYGAYAELERGVEGLISPQDLPGKIALGQILKAQIERIDSESRRVDLSLRDVESKEVDADLPSMQERMEGRRDGAAAVGPSGRSGATLGDVLKQKLGNLGSLPSTSDSDDAESQ